MPPVHNELYVTPPKVKLLWLAPSTRGILKKLKNSQVPLVHPVVFIESYVELSLTETLKKDSMDHDNKSFSTSDV